MPASAEGRWSLLTPRVTPVTATEWSAAIAQQLLTRYGILTREVAAAESIPGGFSAIYDVLRSLDVSGRVRRGFFVGGVAATQFALPPALDLLRSLRQPAEEAESLVLAASDPANPYGAVLKWPAPPDESARASKPETSSPVGADGTPAARRSASRSIGARVVLVDGQLAAYLARGGRTILTWLPEAEPERSRTGRAIAARLIELARTGEGREGGLAVAEIDGTLARDHPLAPHLERAGFVRSGHGYVVPRPRRPPGAPRIGQADPDDIAVETAHSVE